MMDFVAGFSENPLIAILRGLEVKNALAVADVLVEAGFKIIEVPLNSPEPLISIARIAERYSSNALIGAGTVTTPAQVSAVAEAGRSVNTVMPPRHRLYPPSTTPYYDWRQRDWDPAL